MTRCPKCGTAMMEWDHAAEEWRCVNGHRVPAPPPRSVHLAQVAERARRHAQHVAAREQFARDRAVYDERHGVAS